MIPHYLGCRGIAPTDNALSRDPSEVAVSPFSKIHHDDLDH